MNAATNWFDERGGDYALYRPEYPPELGRYLAAIAPKRRCAVDAGCGNGQLTRLLSDMFESVIGIDPSADQIAHATPAPHVRYLCAPAEAMPVADGSADLVTAAQAAHWFDLPAFYAEAGRIAADGAILALISYGVLRIGGAMQQRFDPFYRDEIGPWWPPERRLVDNGYRDIPFPFPERKAPEMAIHVMWTLAAFLGYVATWSAVRRAREAGRVDILAGFAADISRLWGDPRETRAISFPINMRIGTLKA